MYIYCIDKYCNENNCTHMFILSIFLTKVDIVSIASYNIEYYVMFHSHHTQHTNNTINCLYHD